MGGQGNATNRTVQVAALLMFGFPVAALGQIERLVMPGPLVASHAQYEDACRSCHVPFARGLQRDLCLDCHEGIAADLGSSTGFHGLSATVTEQECAECHTDHEGRAHDIVGLNRQTFDHDGTDFALLGSHQEAVCEDCHASEAMFRDAPQQCLGCHEADDQHQGNLGEDCDDCHKPTRWDDAEYDHDQTEFPLTGAHVDASCSDCHENEVYVDTPQQCVACHLEDDEHQGDNGTECDSCHTTREWVDVRFDHFLATGFPLADAHGELACEACHQGNKRAQNNSPGCVSCHQDDDAHDGINGTDCASCHQPTEWLETSFDHARETGFALLGAHAQNACGDCHQTQVELARPPATCYGCHADDEPHAGQLGELCADCHNERGWLEAVRFDHDLTPFPLLGQHSQAICEDCHASRAFHDASADCVECHVEDDHHERRLGTDCGRCHHPGGWLRWAFDHDSETRFRLEGAHTGLDCLACHRTPVDDTVQLSMTCGGCHRTDDVHVGAYGSDCGECHTTGSFAELKGF